MSEAGQLKPCSRLGLIYLELVRLAPPRLTPDVFPCACCTSVVSDPLDSGIFSTSLTNRRASAKSGSHPLLRLLILHRADSGRTHLIGDPSGHATCETRVKRPEGSFHGELQATGPVRTINTRTVTRSEFPARRTCCIAWQDWVAEGPSWGQPY